MHGDLEAGDRDKGETKEGKLKEDPEMGVCWRKGRSGEDPGKIQGRSIDLGNMVLKSIGRRRMRIRTNGCPRDV